jgi:hypothetical protein
MKLSVFAVGSSLQRVDPNAFEHAHFRNSSVSSERLEKHMAMHCTRTKAGYGSAGSCGNTGCGNAGCGNAGCGNTLQYRVCDSPQLLTYFLWKFFRGVI